MVPDHLSIQMFSNAFIVSCTPNFSYPYKLSVLITALCTLRSQLRYLAQDALQTLQSSKPHNKVLISL
jgi:hypothetical protein